MSNSTLKVMYWVSGITCLIIFVLFLSSDAETLPPCKKVERTTMPIMVGKVMTLMPITRCVER